MITQTMPNVPDIAVEEGNLDTTAAKPHSKHFDVYEFNYQYLDSIHNKSNVTERMSKDVSDKKVAAESLSSMSSLRSIYVICTIRTSRLGIY